MILIGLTGSIAMGKSTVGAMFAEMGAPLFDSDAAVHEAYAGAEAHRIEAEFPGVLRDGAVDRRKLAGYVLDDDRALARLEAIVHPMVEAARRAFVARASARGVRRVVIDSPLLMETGMESSVDLVVVVSAPSAEQRRRALARPGMTAERFEALLARQTPDPEKRRRAHFVIDTGGAIPATRKQARDLLRSAAGMTGRSG